MSGLTRSHLSRLELDDFENPSAETFLSLARALKVHPNDLYQAAGYIDENTRFRRSASGIAEEAFAELKKVSIKPVAVLDKINNRVSEVVQYSQWEISEGENSKIIGLLARGFSLEPEVKEGDVIFIDREKVPAPGNIVLCYQEEKVQLIRYGQVPGSNGLLSAGFRVYGVVIGVNRRLN